MSWCVMSVGLVWRRAEKKYVLVCCGAQKTPILFSEAKLIKNWMAAAQEKELAHAVDQK